MVTSVHNHVEPLGYFPDASVDPTEARKQNELVRVGGGY
jgi:hypothetical protein